MVKKGSGGDHQHDTTTPKLDRKTIEKNRRLYIKGLFFKLSSLIPWGSLNVSKDGIAQYEQLDHAAQYITKLRERVEALKQKKKEKDPIVATDHRKEENTGNVQEPVIEIRELGSTVEVAIVCGLNARLAFYDIIPTLERQGAEVTNADFSVANDKMLYTFHCQITVPRIGLEVSTLTEELKKLVQ